MTKRFTIERDPPAGNPARWLGHDNDGRIGWVQGFVVANHFESEGDARSFVRHRLSGLPAARVVAHVIH